MRENGTELPGVPQPPKKTRRISIGKAKKGGTRRGQAFHGGAGRKLGFKSLRLPRLSFKKPSLGGFNLASFIKKKLRRIAKSSGGDFRNHGFTGSGKGGRTGRRGKW